MDWRELKQQGRKQEKNANNSAERKLGAWMVETANAIRTIDGDYQAGKISFWQRNIKIRQRLTEDEDFYQREILRIRAEGIRNTDYDHIPAKARELLKRCDR